MTLAEPLYDRTVDLDFAAWSRAVIAHVESLATTRLPPTGRAPERLHEAMRYAVLAGGKRVRALLTYASGAAAAAPLGALDAIALAVEYVHAYSLVHDDLPCMDDDVLRRGKPTTHVVFGEATAMLAGDALQAEAFDVLAQAPIAPAKVVALMRTLAQAAGTAGMCGGQAIDLAAIGRPLSLDELEQMHRMKTGALLRAAIMMGAAAGELPPAAVDAIQAYADALGLAFQVVDDILDVEGDAVALGKTAGKDALQNKPTYVSVLGLAAAKQWAQRLHAQARAALACCEARADGLQRLRELADFILLRTH